MMAGGFSHAQKTRDLYCELPKHRTQQSLSGWLGNRLFLLFLRLLMGEMVHSFGKFKFFLSKSVPPPNHSEGSLKMAEGVVTRKGSLTLVAINTGRQTIIFCDQSDLKWPKIPHPKQKHGCVYSGRLPVSAVPPLFGILFDFVYKSHKMFCLERTAFGGVGALLFGPCTCSDHTIT